MIELLVVVTIIVVLLALLAPAMDRAIYQGLAAVCASNLDSMAVAAGVYAGEFRQRYPYRRVTDNTLNPPAYFGTLNTVADTTTMSVSGIRPGIGGANAGGSGQYPYLDDRPMLEPYFGGGLKMMHDPLMGAKLDFTVKDNNATVFVDYMLYFSVRFYPQYGGGKGMHKIGDRLEWTETGTIGGRAKRTHRLAVLASDQDALVSLTDPYQKTWSSHPDDEGKLTFVGGYYPGVYTFAKWLRPEDRERGPIDTHYAFTDGSVERFKDVTFDESERDDGRMGLIPIPSAGSDGYIAQRVPRGR